MYPRSARFVHLIQVVALLTLLVLGASLYRSLSFFVAAGQQVEWTRDVIDEVHKARLGSLRSGIWLRNYALTPSPELLARVRSSAAEGAEALRRLVALTRARPEQNLEVHALEREMGDLLEAYLAGADLAEQQGLSALQPVLNSRVQVDHTRRVRERLDKIEKGARESLTEQVRLEKRYLQQIRRLMLVLAVSLAVGLAWSGWMLLQLVRRRGSVFVTRGSRSSQDSRS